MKKYLREIEMAGVILASTGIVNSLIWGSIYGGWICGIGILLMLIVFLYKAFSTRNSGSLDQGIRRKILLRTDKYGGFNGGSR